MFGTDEEQAIVDYMHDPNWMGERQGAFAPPAGVPAPTSAPPIVEAPRLVAAQAPAAARAAFVSQPVAVPFAAQPAAPTPMMATLPPGYVAQQQQQQYRIDELETEYKQRGHMLGFSTVATGLGMVAGIRLGGAYGAVAGSLFGGAAVNAYRAFLFSGGKSKDDKREAVVSGTWAVVSAALGGYVLWVSRDERAPMRRNSSTDRDAGSLTKNAARSCGIRAII